jgi:hypothetical protein
MGNLKIPANLGVGKALSHPMVCSDCAPQILAQTRQATKGNDLLAPDFQLIPLLGRGRGLAAKKWATRQLPLHWEPKVLQVLLDGRLDEHTMASAVKGSLKEATAPCGYLVAFRLLVQNI